MELFDRGAMDDDVVNKTPAVRVDLALEHGDCVQPRENNAAPEQADERSDLVRPQIQSKKVQVLEQRRTQQLQHGVADVYETFPLHLHLQMAQAANGKVVAAAAGRAVRAKAAVEFLELRARVKNFTQTVTLLLVQRQLGEAATQGGQNLSQHAAVQFGRVQ